MKLREIFWGWKHYAFFIHHISVKCNDLKGEGSPVDNRTFQDCQRLYKYIVQGDAVAGNVGGLGWGVGADVSGGCGTSCNLLSGQQGTFQIVSDRWLWARFPAVSYRVSFWCTTIIFVLFNLCLQQGVELSRNFGWKQWWTSYFYKVTEPLFRKEIFKATGQTNSLVECSLWSKIMCCCVYCYCTICVFLLWCIFGLIYKYMKI